MSNGVPPCCPLEICCDAPTALQKTAESIAEHIGTSTGVEAGSKVLDWMAKKNLVFAPKEFKPGIQAVAAMARAQHDKTSS
jgi:hypothetical protein